MKILYLGFWSIEDGLTTSTIFPNLEKLISFPHIEKIVFCTIERGNREVVYPGPKSEKIVFEPLYSKNLKLSLLTKVFDFILFPQQLKKICREHNIDKIIARGAPAGVLANKVKLPYVVESFEPHADYMLESGVWQWWNPKYIFEKKWENEVKQTADNIITVSHNYAQQLQKESVNPNKIEVVPCCVNLQHFSLNMAERNQIRNQLGIHNKTKVGVYVGKFGGIYYDRDAFEIFKKTHDVFSGEMFLIILTPDNANEVKQKLTAVDFPLDKTYVSKVPHAEVSGYLSAADFAFSTIKPAPSRQYCSAVKNGEYWASGLPILMTEGVGDDTQIIEKEGGGVIFNLEKNNLDASLKQLKTLIEQNNRQENFEKIALLAKKHRNFDIVTNVYQKIL